jgi:hypothetical protein
LASASRLAATRLAVVVTCVVWVLVVTVCCGIPVLLRQSGFCEEMANGPTSYLISMHVGYTNSKVSFADESLPATALREQMVTQAGTAIEEVIRCHDPWKDH